MCRHLLIFVVQMFRKNQERQRTAYAHQPRTTPKARADIPGVGQASVQTISAGFHATLKTIRSTFNRRFNDLIKLLFCHGFSSILLIHDDGMYQRKKI